jgi:hypothetical protein
MKCHPGCHKHKKRAYAPQILSTRPLGAHPRVVLKALTGNEQAIRGAGPCQLFTLEIDHDLAVNIKHR